MSTRSPENPSPILQRPGTGLPWWERLAIRYVIFPRACRRLVWAGANRLFQDEGARILAIWDSLPSERLNEQTLIDRVRGIEDSSRFWSVAMTVDHLNIVGSGIRGIIGRLRRGESPNRIVRVEDVKPRGEKDPAEVRVEFVKLLEAAKADSPISRGEGSRLAHPWFGLLDAFQWHCFLGLHQRIHRKQIEAIRDGLKSQLKPPM
jgi:hypothetical protein